MDVHRFLSYKDMAARVSQDMSPIDYLQFVLAMERGNLRNLSQDDLFYVLFLKWGAEWKNYHREHARDMPNVFYRAMSFFIFNALAFEGSNLSTNRLFIDSIALSNPTYANAEKFFFYPIGIYTFNPTPPIGVRFETQEIHDRASNGRRPQNVPPFFQGQFDDRGYGQIPFAIIRQTLYSILDHGWNVIEITEKRGNRSEPPARTTRITEPICANCQAKNPQQVCANYANCGTRYCDQDCANEHWEGTTNHYLFCSQKK